MSREWIIVPSRSSLATNTVKISNNVLRSTSELERVKALCLQKSVKFFKRNCDSQWLNQKLRCQQYASLLVKKESLNIKWQLQKHRNAQSLMSINRLIFQRATGHPTSLVNSGRQSMESYCEEWLIN